MRNAQLVAVAGAVTLAVVIAMQPGAGAQGLPNP